MARSLSHSSLNKNPPTVERVAFNPFTPQQDLINELIRNMVNPDTDIGQTYYVGQVVNIFEPNNKDIEIRDIFYSPTDNFERVTKDVSDAKYNIGRKILLVNIPSFTTNGKSAGPLTDLNYDNFTKIRVEYSEKEVIKIGNIVKIQFRNKTSFYDPYVIGVVDVSSTKITQETNSAKTLFAENVKCNILGISAPSDFSAIDYGGYTKPAGGYKQALEEIDNIFSEAFINVFRKNIKPSELGGDVLKITPGSIGISESVFSDFSKNKNYKKIKVVLDPDLNSKDFEYFIKIPITISPDKFTVKFINLLKGEFSSKMGYLLVEDKKKNGSYLLDLNLDKLGNKERKIEKTVKDYIKVSKEFNNTAVFYSRLSSPKESPQTISGQTAVESCVKGAVEGNTVYYEVKDDLLPTFLSGEMDTNKFLEKEYFYQIAGIKKLTDLSNLKNKFYSTNSSKLEYKTQKTDMTLNLTSLDTVYLPLVTKFLKDLKILILSNEKNAEEVLILPKQVIKIYKNGATLDGEDSNSRHYYGLAADIVVYLKISDGDKQKIVQVPPEIVILYAEKAKTRENLLIGYGLFQKYTHIEFLLGSGADSKFYIGELEESRNELQKDLQLVSENSRVSRLQTVVGEKKSYRTSIGLYGPLERLIQQ